MFSSKKLFITLLFLSIPIYAFGGVKMDTGSKTMLTLDDIQPASWEKLAQKKIFFGHQSVGNNIMKGIEELMKKNPSIRLHVLESSKPSDFSSGIFAHSQIGRNEDPEYKIHDFVRVMDKGIGGKADIAFFKFCFVDIDSGTDVEKLFTDYKNTMAMLKEKYPQTMFVHCTVPLLRKKITTPKSLLKKLLGKDDGFFDNSHNVARNRFNDLLRKEYEGRAPIFDLAGIESTYPDGSRETFTANGKRYYSLVPEYTYDGGHLNELGRTKAAEQLLLLLVSL